MTDEEIHEALENAAACGQVIMRFFAFKHLPCHLIGMSREFAKLAVLVSRDGGQSAERTMALRKLLEAKDCAVRARL